MHLVLLTFRDNLFADSQCELDISNTLYLYVSYRYIKYSIPVYELDMSNTLYLSVS